MQGSLRSKWEVICSVTERSQISHTERKFFAWLRGVHPHQLLFVTNEWLE